VEASGDAVGTGDELLVSSESDCCGVTGSGGRGGDFTPQAQVAKSETTTRTALIRAKGAEETFESLETIMNVLGSVRLSVLFNQNRIMSLSFCLMKDLEPEHQSDGLHINSDITPHFPVRAYTHQESNPCGRYKATQCRKRCGGGVGTFDDNRFGQSAEKECSQVLAQENIITQ